MHFQIHSIFPPWIGQDSGKYFLEQLIEFLIVVEEVEMPRICRGTGETVRSLRGDYLVVRGEDGRVGLVM